MPEIEQVVPDYSLLALIGQGGYGEVYLAKSATGQYRAVKIVYRDRLGSAEAFDREFRGVNAYESVSRRHEGLVDIRHVGRIEDRGFFYYVMDAADDLRRGREIDPLSYAPRTLRSELATRAALPIEECIEIGLTLASALAFLQENSLLHRDIKPDNVIFIRGHLKLADVGLVADVRSARSLVGTEGYEPPEHHGEFSGDVFSLGKLLYEISTGRDRRDFGNAASEEADTDDSRFGRFNSIVCRACAERYKDRYQTAKALHKALAELRQTSTSTVDSIPSGQHSRWHRPLRVVLGSVAVLAVTLAGKYIFGQSRVFVDLHGTPSDVWSSNKAAEDVLSKNMIAELENMRVNIKELNPDTPQVTVSSNVTVAHQAVQEEPAEPVVLVHEPTLSAGVTPEQQDMAKEQAAYANTMFSAVAMVPEVTFSPRLQPPQASVRPAGKDYQYFYQTWTNQQWLALIGLLSGSDSTNWPDRSDIDIAARRLREKDWSIVVSCPGVTNGVLMGLVFDAENSGFLHVWREWTRHPDGRSWVHEWKPSTTHIALLIGDAHLLCCRADMLREEYAKKADDLARVKDLGEISAEEFLSKLAALQEETRQRVCKWVSQDAESEIARLQDLARRERKRDGDILAAEDIRLMESYGLNVWLAKEKRRQLGAGTEKEWVAAVQEYRDSTPSFDLDAMVMSAEVAGDFGIEDQPPSGPGRRLVGAWKILRVEGVDSGRSDSTLVIVFGEQYDVRMVYQEVGKRKPRTLTIDGSYDLAGSTLYLDMEDSAENDPFVLWYEGQNLVMQQFDSRWIFTPFTE